MSERGKFGEPLKAEWMDETFDGCGDMMRINFEDGSSVSYVPPSKAPRLVDCWNACAGMDDPAAEIARLRAEVEKLNKRAEVDWDRNSALTAENKKLLAEISKLRAEVERLLDAVRIYDDMPLGHMHFDRQGTHGLNCELCRQQREHRDKARAALEEED